MASDDTSRWQWAFRLLVLVLFVAPLVVQLVAVGDDVLGSFSVGLPGLLDPGLLDSSLFDPSLFDPVLLDVASLDSTATVQTVGLAVAVLVALLLVCQKRRSRGQRSSEEAPEQKGDRRVEGSGEVYAPYAYNNQQAARRESKRIRDRAEKIAEAERDAYER